MSQRRLFYRKVGYFSAIAVLLLPLSWLSAPSVSEKAAPDGQASRGGKLAQLRNEYKLGQTNLGEIDPASETIKLATLGLRGIAVNLLWEKATEYKKTENWTKLSSTLEQITKLQPNFISVWKFQGWNLSYNVSVEFDNYHDRYYWVIRGIDFLKEGIKYNEDNVDLMSDIGWFIGQKIGRADEHKQYRRLFKADDDFHPEDRLRDDRDNWLVGREWYRLAEDAVVLKNMPLKRPTGKGRSELLFFSLAPMSLMNYSDAIEEEGTFGEVAQLAWRRAGDGWKEYSEREIAHTSGTKIRLGDQQLYKADVERYLNELEELAPGLREKIEQESREALSSREQEVLDTPFGERNDEQRNIAREVNRKLKVTHQDVADRIGQLFPDKARQANRAAASALNSEQLAVYARRYRSVVNFDYWRTRAEFEQTSDALTARSSVYEGDRQRNKAFLEDAKRLYEEGFARWQAVFEAFPEVLEDSLTGDDVLEVIGHYRDVLGELDEEFPEDFPFWDIIEEHDFEGKFRDLRELRKSRLEAAGDAEQADETGGSPAENEPPAEPKPTGPALEDTTGGAARKTATESIASCGCGSAMRRGPILPWPGANFAV